MKKYETLISIIFYLGIIYILFNYSDDIQESYKIKPAITLAILIALKELLFTVFLKIVKSVIYKKKFKIIYAKFIASQNQNSQEQINFEYLNQQLNEISFFLSEYDILDNKIEDIQLFKLKLNNINRQGIESYDQILEKLKIN